jgi:spore germination cell wall hydrolase CwlJ-like protein
MIHINLEKGLSTVAAKMCAVGLIHMLTFGSNVGTFLSPSVALAGDVNQTQTVAVDTDNEILWFARAIYSETKIPAEQALIAWVIRNRVESPKYPDTYREVVLQNGQFSGFSPRDAQYRVNTTLSFAQHSPAWDSAVATAKAVYSADPALRPLGGTVLHFYSPVSVSAEPQWAEGKVAYQVIHDQKTNKVRFAFYADIN